MSFHVPMILCNSLEVDVSKVKTDRVGFKSDLSHDSIINQV